MGTFKNWLELQMPTPKPGQIGANLPTQANAKITRAVNDFVGDNPNFTGDMISTPSTKNQAEIAGEAGSEIMGGALKNTGVPAAAVNKQVVASAGLDPSNVFKMMRKNMKKNMGKK